MITLGPKDVMLYHNCERFFGLHLLFVEQKDGVLAFAKES